MSMLTLPPVTTTVFRRTALILFARLRRLLNGWIASAIAYRERQAAWVASREIEARGLNHTRTYYGPIDDALERAARFRERKRSKS